MESERRRKQLDAFWGAHFERRGALFETTLAKTPQEKEAFYRLRAGAFARDVYILFGDALQRDMDTKGVKDVFDEEATHYLTHFKPTGDLIGGIRFVAPRPFLENPHAFPSTLCSPELAAFVEKVGAPNCLEVSRFLMDREGAERVEGYLHKFHKEISEKSPPKLLYFIADAYRICQSQGVSYLIGSFDKHLLAILRLVGIATKTVGPPLKAFDQLQPFYIDVARVMKSLQKANPRVYHFLLEEHDA
ncbi:MAG: hypothetical protein LCH26_04155 [Proteobacteria bacterium]|nr:hypothetical protein [Pseudomonadota bacterium]